VVALFQNGSGADFQWSWLWGFGHFGGLSGFAGGALIAAFYFWGWDVTANLSEETSNSQKNSGLGGLIGVFGVFALFELFTIVTNMLIAQKDINSDTPVMTIIGDAVGKGWGGKALVLAVVLSTIATLETTLIQVTRSLFAMGRDNTLPAIFGRTHRRWQTPWFAILVITVISLALFVASANIGSVGDIMGDAVAAIGLQICIYYALAGIAVVVAYRKVIFKSLSNAVFVGIWPGLGAAFMVFIFVEALPTLTARQIGIGLGAVAIGLLPMVWYWVKGSEYYTNPPARLDAALAAEQDAEFGSSILVKDPAPADGLATDL
jgi:amino acid transporter